MCELREAPTTQQPAGIAAFYAAYTQLSNIITELSDCGGTGCNSTTEEEGAEHIPQDSSHLLPAHLFAGMCCEFI